MESSWTNGEPAPDAPPAGPRKSHRGFWFWTAAALTLSSVYITVELEIRNALAGFYLPIHRERPDEIIPKWRFRFVTEDAWRWMWRWSYDEPADAGDTRWEAYRELWHKEGTERPLAPADRQMLLAVVAALEESHAPLPGAPSTTRASPPELPGTVQAWSGIFGPPPGRADLERCREILARDPAPRTPDYDRLVLGLLQWAPMSEAERRRMDKDLARNRANNRLHAWAGLPAGFQYLLAPTAVVMSLCLLAGARSGKERVVLLVCAAASAASLGFLWYLMRGAHVF